MARRPPADLNVVAAFYKRWEPYEAQRRDIATDLKELFAEAKGNGLNAKSLRSAFADFYRTENQTADEAEKRSANDTDFELYLSSLARVREDDDEFDPETGEIKSTTTNGGDNETSAVSEQHLIDRRRQDDAQEGHSAHDMEVRTRPVNSTEEPGRSLASVETPTGSDIPATISEPASPLPEIAEPGDRGAVVPSAAPVVEPFVAEYAAPGVVVIEKCPPEGIVAHPFAACWPVNSIDVTGGVREPIVKIGKLILDGRGRYFAARDEGIEYPVVQYQGADPLLDCIRWNLASRKPSEQQRRLIAGKLAKLEPARADDIMRAFDRHLEAAE